ncbi:MAG: hypothetical protein ACJA09_003367 [Alcanivorax sp.]|jgi:hypothetical protein
MKIVLAPALRLVAALLALSFLGACASGPPETNVDFKPDYDFSGVKKIGFFKNSGEVTGDNPLQLSDMQKNRIDAALQFALENKGFQMVDDPSQADMLISWHLMTQEKTDVRTYQTGMSTGYYGGYNRYNRYSAYNCWNCGGQTDVSVKNYTQGSFFVDMIDPTLKQSVWRGVTQSKLKGEHGEDQGRYNAAATLMFVEFPPN